MYKVSGPGIDHEGLTKQAAENIATKLSKDLGKAHKVSVLRMTPGELARLKGHK